MFIVRTRLRVKFMVLVIFRVRLSFRVRAKARFTFIPMAMFSVRFRVSV